MIIAESALTSSPDVGSLPGLDACFYNWFLHHKNQTRSKSVGKSPRYKKCGFLACRTTRTNSVTFQIWGYFLSLSFSRLQREESDPVLGTSKKYFMQKLMEINV